MKKTRDTTGSPTARTANAAARREVSPETMDGIFARVGSELREGHSTAAEQLLTDTLGRFTLSPVNVANLKRLLSFTLETTGRYKESLETMRPFELEENLAQLDLETRTRVLTQLAISYSNLGDQPKAATLLKDLLDRVAGAGGPRLSGGVEIGLARVYRKLAEFPICRDHAERALEHYRESGDWLGMAEAYREIALSLHQEGNSGKAIEYFNLGVSIIGSNSAPFMLGKLYTELSGAYWTMRRPKDGVKCLERSIEFFDRTEHALNSVIAYNNLGLNLMLIGQWDRAEQMIGRALEICLELDHVHAAGIYDSLGELKILRGLADEAEPLLTKAIETARAHKHPWYAVQAMRNKARCYLDQKKFTEAVDAAEKTIVECREIGDKHYVNLAVLVLAEAELGLGNTEGCLSRLSELEKNDPSDDFFVLGSIQRIRGLAALDEDPDVAVHHFSRALTIFETAEDIYHTGVMHLLLGENLAVLNPQRARRHLSMALDVFRRLGRKDLEAACEKAAAELGTDAAEIPSKRSARPHTTVAAHLLVVRLAEATASRELLFRELVAVLQQESEARRILIAEFNEHKRLYPFITHGYTHSESADICSRIATALERGDDNAADAVRDAAVFRLHGTAASPAFLMLSPKAGAILSDESPLQPLIRVVELGMDMIALRERGLTQRAESVSPVLASGSLMPGFIHSSPAMTALVEDVYKIRSSDVTVLVTGESGTGKELVSRAVHTLSKRKDAVFVPFNCTAVPKELAEGHLFGYKKGAFTGAVNDSPGTIRTADGGTLFLDEVGDLPLDVQPKLLRFLQEGEIQPLGEKKPIKVDVRIIAATNMPLEERVAAGTFREDLYYRLNVIRLRVPPLRERRAEIPPMVNYYVNHYSERFGKHGVTFTPQTVDMLMVCNWEGNVRQLCNEIQRIVARAENGEVITPAALSPELKRSAQPLVADDDGAPTRPITSYDTVIAPFSDLSDGGTLEDAVSGLEIKMIRSSLSRHNWNISRVAAELGLTRRGLYLKLTRYGIEKAA